MKSLLNLNLLNECFTQDVIITIIGTFSLHNTVSTSITQSSKVYVCSCIWESLVWNKARHYTATQCKQPNVHVLNRPSYRRSINAIAYTGTNRIWQMLLLIHHLSEYGSRSSHPNLNNTLADILGNFFWMRCAPQTRLITLDV